MESKVRHLLTTFAHSFYLTFVHYIHFFIFCCAAFVLSENTILNNALNCTGEAYEEIAKLTDAQAKNDWEAMGDMMHDYRGLLTGWPVILQTHAVSYYKSSFLKSQ